MFDVDGTWIYGKNKQYVTRFSQQVPNSIPVISGVTINNGVNYYTVDKLMDYEIFSDCLTISTRGEYSGTVTYHEGDFVLANNILTMPMPNWSKKAKLFIASSLNALPYGGYSGYPRKETLKNDIILLPITSAGTIDFYFMDEFISELEQERISELEQERISELKAYLKATGLDDITLNEEELQAIDKFYRGGVKWKEYQLDTLFDKVKVVKLPQKVNDLPTTPNREYCLPVLTAGIQNQGLSCYAPKENATILKNIISISANGANTGATFYQSKEFTILQDAYAIKWKYTDKMPNEEQSLFLVTSISKRIYGNYQWTNKAGWEKIKSNVIYLPIIDSNEIDVAFMGIFIRAIEKLVIKDVVDYADKKIATTKQVVG